MNDPKVFSPEPTDFFDASVLLLQVAQMQTLQTQKISEEVADTLAQIGGILKPVRLQETENNEFDIPPKHLPFCTPAEFACAFTELGALIFNSLDHQYKKLDDLIEELRYLNSHIRQRGIG